MHQQFHPLPSSPCHMILPQPHLRSFTTIPLPPNLCILWRASTTLPPSILSQLLHTVPAIALLSQQPSPLNTLPQIRVFCRVRPHPQSAVRCLPGGTALSLSVDGKEHAFSFDKVFGPQTGQEQVWARLP